MVRVEEKRPETLRWTGTRRPIQLTAEGTMTPPRMLLPIQLLTPTEGAWQAWMVGPVTRTERTDHLLTVEVRVKPTMELMPIQLLTATEAA